MWDLQSRVRTNDLERESVIQETLKASEGGGIPAALWAKVLAVPDIVQEQKRFVALAIVFVLALHTVRESLLGSVK